jgi:Skp family chaperone for outer membrane proteins
MSNVSKVSERTNPTIKKIRTSSIIRNKDRRKMEQEQLEQMRRKREPNVEKVERTRDENEIISYDLQDYVQEEYISDNSDN